MSDTLTPSQCPRYLTCNAAICPIDSRWREAVHLPGEKVCHYLLGSGKAGAAEKFEDDPVFAASLTVLPEIAAKHPDIRRRVEKAALTGFRGANLPSRQSPEGCDFRGALPELAC